jgi:hypothetical protein
MNAIHEELLSITVKILSARRAEIDSTVRAIEADPRSTPAAAVSRNKYLDDQIRTALQHLYDVIELVDAAIAHLTRLAAIRQ